MYVQLKVTIYREDNKMRNYLLKNNFTCCRGNGEINKNKIYHVHDRDAIKASKCTVFIQCANALTPLLYATQFKSKLGHHFDITRVDVTCSPSTSL